MLLPGSVSPSANTVRATRTQVASQIGVTLFLLFLIPGVGLMIYLQSPIPLIGFLLAGLYLLFAVKVAQQWEKAAVLRLGEYRGLRGPGLFLIIPVIDSVSEFIDQRIRVTEVKAESTLTRDAVPVFVDAVVFWLVWNAEKSILEVRGLRHGHPPERPDGAARIDRPAHADRDDDRPRVARPRIAEDPRRQDQPVGRHRAVGGDPRRADPAGAGRRHVARGAGGAGAARAQHPGQAETEIAEKFAQAAAMYQDNPIALHLRAMNMLYEAIKEKGSMVIVPSSAVETMGLGGMMGMAAIGKHMIPPERAASGAEVGPLERKRSMRIQRWASALIIAACACAQTNPAPVDRAREAVEWVLHGEYDKVYAHSDAQMQQAVPRDAWRMQVAPMIAVYGKFVSFGAPATQQISGNTVVVLPAVFEKGAADFTVSITKDGRISGFFIKPGQRPISAKAAAAKAREAVEWVLHGEYKKLVGHSDEAMKKAMPVETWQRQVTPAVAGFGELKSVGEPVVKEAPPNMAVVVPVQFEKAAVDFTVAVAADGRVAGLSEARG